jgi:long-subunit acyl-CoA synthetase (AMP-forming)
LSTVGKVFPHTQAKIVDVDGAIVPCGVKGEICTSGYALQRGYLKNEEKTLEAMRVDANGTVWMHTGDEGTIDQQGYCRVTGRIKDLIIRGERYSNNHEKQ